MEIIVSTRHANVTDDLRRHAEESMTRVAKFERGASRVSVVLTEEKNRFVAEANLTVRKGGDVHAEAEGPDLRTAIDRLADKLATQLKRGRDRRRMHKGKAAAEEPLVEDSES